MNPFSSVDPGCIWEVSFLLQNILNPKYLNSWSSCLKERDATAPPPTLGSREAKKYRVRLLQSPVAAKRNKTMAAQEEVPGVPNVPPNVPSLAWA